MNTYEKAINTVISALVDNHVPFTVEAIYDGGLQLRFPWCDGDIACHAETYGSALGHVESYQFPWDEDAVTELTPEEAALYLVNYWNEVTTG